MTTTLAPEPATERPQAPAPTARRSREALIFAGATAVAALHGLDDAFFHRQPGVGLGQHALAAAIMLVVGIGAVYAFPSMRTAARAAVAFLFGSLAVVNGTLHIKHVAGQGMAASDLTGLLAAAAGLVLIGLAVAIPSLHRGEGTASLRRRWAKRVVAVPLGFLAILFVVVPMGFAITDTHKFRADIPAPPAGYEEVAFEATDGVDISGWYRPTRNGATILVVHGGGSDRTSSLAHARLLARHGYGVLLHDSRGRGESEGQQNSWGWGWTEDVAGALAFLKARDEVDPERIGALGLSTGADVLVELAGQRTDLKAVVADGTAAGSFDDQQAVVGLNPLTPFNAVEFATVRALAGGEPGSVLEDVVDDITSPLLLIAAGPPEKPYAEAYDRAAGSRPLDVWYLPDASHTGAIREAAPEYEQRVSAFFDGALKGG